jgi:uncharacterized short protein YbdD (DUF466 family)
MRSALDVARGIRWYVKEMTGESKWDKYVEGCRRDGVEPMSRRNYERHRAEHAEARPQSRCC